MLIFILKFLQSGIWAVIIQGSNYYPNISRMKPYLNDLIK
jgi:hypothetical protein